MSDRFLPSSSYLIVAPRMTCRSVLTPNVTFSGSAQDGTPISTQLSMSDASFVTGVFATNGSTSDNSSKSSSAAVNHHGLILIPTNTLAAFPTGLVITSVWALLLLMIMGYSTMNKVQARSHYRKKMKSKTSGGVGKS